MDAFTSMSREQLLAVVSTLVKQQGHELTVGQVAELYLAHMQTRLDEGEICVEYHRNVVRDLGRFVDFHGGKLVKETGQQHLTSFIRNHPNWRSAHIQKAVSGHIVTCFAWAKEDGVIPENPFRRIKTRQQPRNRKPCTPADYVLLMRHGHRALRRILYFLRKTGCRTSEARELVWVDVFLEADEPHVILRKHKMVRKTGQPRIFALDKGTVRFLLALKRQAPQNIPNVFFNTDGRPWTRRALALAFRRTIARAGLPMDLDHRISAYAYGTCTSCKPFSLAIPRE